MDTSSFLGMGSTLHASPIVTVFATGFVLPESISLAPASFGLPAGTLVVADGGDLANSNPDSMLYTVPGSGGTPTPIGGGFSNNGGTFGGMFAPASFGALGGDYLAFGYTGIAAGSLLSQFFERHTHRVLQRNGPKLLLTRQWLTRTFRIWRGVG